MLVKKIRSRGANIVVEANGEVLFAPGMVLGNWKRRFSNRISHFTAEAAPTNKRPRWGHYGKPLKRTITSATRTRITRGGGFFYIATGSTAPHAYYVDQGTGIHNGGSPYPAKILPPWQHGSASLYEATWRPTGPGGRKVPPVMIKGQEGQHFFDTGLKRAFQSMRLRSFQVPGEGVSGLTGAMNTFPTGLANFLGNTAVDAGFRASLTEWRTWRDEAWGAGEGLGRGGGIGSRAQDRFRDKAQSATQAKTPTKSTKKPTPKKTQKKPQAGYATVRDKQDAAVAQFKKQNPNIKIIGRVTYGLAVKTAKGPFIIPWSRLYNLID